MFFLKKKPSTVNSKSMDSNVVIKFVNNITKKVPELNLRFKNFNSTKSRLVYEGNYEGGSILIRLNIGVNMDKGIKKLVKIKNDIDYTLSYFKKKYNDGFTFLEFVEYPSFNCVLKIEVDGEIKEIKYRPHVHRLEELLPVLLKELDLNDTSGTYIVGGKRLEEVLLKHLDKQVKINILE